MHPLVVAILKALSQFGRDQQALRLKEMRERPAQRRLPPPRRRSVTDQPAKPEVKEPAVIEEDLGAPEDLSREYLPDDHIPTDAVPDLYPAHFQQPFILRPDEALINLVDRGLAAYHAESAQDHQLHQERLRIKERQGRWLIWALFAVLAILAAFLAGIVYLVAIDKNIDKLVDFIKVIVMIALALISGGAFKNNSKGDKD